MFSLLDSKFLKAKQFKKQINYPVLQSHRGFWKDGATENTIEAFEESYRFGYQMVEFDVRLSKDKVPFLHHDRNLSRITMDPRNIESVDSHDLEDMGLSSFESVLKSKNIPEFLNVEIKSSSLLDFELEIELIRLVRKFRCEERILFSTFNPLSCLYLSQNQSLSPVALLVCEVPEQGNPYWAQKSWALRLAQPHLLHLGFHKLTKERMKAFEAAQVPVNVWTVNELSKAQELFEIGASSIITDSILPKDLVFRKGKQK